MSTCLKTVRDDYFYFGYSFDLAISIKKILDEKWEINTYERGIITNQEVYSNEYLSCLKFLYHIKVITTDDPNIMKLIDYSEDWELFEKNNVFYFFIQSAKPYLYRTFIIILNSEELEKYRLQGRNFLSLLQFEIDVSVPIRTSSKYHNRKVNDDLEKELYDASCDEYDLRDNYYEDTFNLIENNEAFKNHSPELWQEPQKNGPKIVVTILGLIVLFYIIFFGSVALTN